MVVIPPIFTSDGKITWFYLYISLSELAAKSSLYIVVAFCEAQSCVCLSITHWSSVSDRRLYVTFHSLVIQRLYSLDIWSSEPKIIRSSFLDKKYTNLALNDFTGSDPIIAVIITSIPLQQLSHHQYKTIGHLMISWLHFSFTFTLIYSSQLLYRSNTIALSFALCKCLQKRSKQDRPR